jgi:hypothetical protein
MVGGTMMELWAYFNIVTPTNGNIMLFFLVILAIFCLSGAAAVGIADTHFGWATLIGGTVGLSWFLFLMWLFMGRSTRWSLAIKSWFNQ